MKRAAHLEQPTGPNPLAKGVLADALWSSDDIGAGGRIYWRGHPDSRHLEGIRKLFEATPKPKVEQLANLIKECRGHFAFVITSGNRAYIAVDHSRSIPLFFARYQSSWLVDDRPMRLCQNAKLEALPSGSCAHLAIAMSGCTVGANTLYQGLEMLRPGECAILDKGVPAHRSSYNTFAPWKVRYRPEQELQREFEQVTLSMFERMFKSVQGRKLVVPLSGGYDSRLIVAMAHELGHKDILCFTYGRPGNFEAEASRQICERLGIPWAFVPSSVSRMRRFYSSELFGEYVAFAESCSAIPFVQDVFALDQLKTDGALPDDAVVVNGQSGDFISGNHIPAVIATKEFHESSAEERKKQLLHAHGKKHFSLWQSLRTPNNLKELGTAVWREITDAGGELGDADTNHGLLEFAEFQDRQSKYVIAGQRSYDYLGLDWRLPLWDADYLHFWQSVPLEHKVNQVLYRTSIEKNNWADIWRNLPINRKTIRPKSIIPIRLAAKLVSAPFGRDSWHAVERRLFQYWMEVTCHTAAVPYRRWALDGRGARNTASWLAEAYLERHNLQLPGDGLTSADGQT